VNGVSVVDVLRVLEDASTGAHKNALLYASDKTKLDYLVRSALFTLKIPTDDWQQYTDLVEAAFDKWHEQRAGR
jgi:hypothetical protein